MASAEPQSGGIQLLLQAEQDAQRIITNARAAKSARLRQAKEEAEKESAAYRAQREEEYQNKKSGTSGDSDSTVKRLSSETDSKIKQLQKEAKTESVQVIKKLIHFVTEVKV